MARTLATTKTLILNEKGELLLLKIGVHTQRPERSYTYDLPGGFVDEGESEHEGALREVMEETAIALNADDIRLVYGMTDYDAEHDVSVTHLLYITKLDHTPDVTVSWEHESFDWVDFATALKRFEDRPRYHTFIEHVQKYDLFTF
jgi:8-oxo-dGTP pyrophosphatase MutT (NUDIX family)